MTDFIGWIGAVCFLASGFPQAWKCFKQKHAEGISNAFLFFWLAGEVCLITATLGQFGWISWLMFSYASGAFCALVILYYRMFPRKYPIAFGFFTKRK